VEFEWDEEKRAATFAARGLDFAFATLFFDGRPVVDRASPRGGEERTMSIAFVEGSFLTLVWTKRNEKIRVISMRRSRVAEERAYRSIHN